MSLSSIIHYQKPIRDGLRARITRPSIYFDQIKAPPLTGNSQIVGAAFDYLLRFYIQRVNDFSQSSMWVSEIGAELINNFLCDYLSQDNKANAYLIDAKKEHRRYLKTGSVTENLLICMLRLAYLDVACRKGPFFIDWEAIESPHLEDVADLRAMLELVGEASFKAEKLCLLNPNFGIASELVGGADTDLLIDDCLIDIKTTKYSRIDSRDFFQLVCYYLLYRFDGISCGDFRSARNKINYLGIYFARHGYFWKVAVDEVFVPTPLRETAAWFFKSVCKSKSKRHIYLRRFRSAFGRNLLMSNRTV
ncbi:MAG: hypothetical protein AB7E73_15695 [Burkholderiales bacterium]